MYKFGSKKWIALRKWRYYYNMFLAIADSQGFSLTLSPAEYMDQEEKDPRLMAILLEIQKAARKKTSDNIEAMKKKNAANQKNKYPMRGRARRSW